MPLTNLTIENTMPSAEGKQIKLFDAGGLYLLIKPTNHRYWRFKYRWAGRERLLALGVYPEISLKMARARRDEARRQLANGQDPSEKRRADKVAARIAAASSFKAIALEWHHTKSGEWAPGHADSVLRTLELHLFPDLGARPIADIEPMALLDVLKKVEKAGKLDTANRLRERCEAIFRLAIKTGRARYNPAAELVGALKKRISKPRPALSQEQLPAFLVALRDTDGISLVTRGLMMTIAVCMTRVGETVRAEWSHIDLAKGLWTIPPENRKLKSTVKPIAQPHLVPLPRQIVEMLEELRYITGQRRYVFAHHHTPGGKHMSESTPNTVLERLGFSGKNTKNGSAVIHGFRATASTILNESGLFSPDAIERQLSHLERNQVRAAYNRAAYLEERRAMVQWWASYIEMTTEKGCVIPVDQVPL